MLNSQKTTFPLKNCLFCTEMLNAPDAEHRPISAQSSLTHQQQQQHLYTPRTTTHHAHTPRTPSGAAAAVARRLPPVVRPLLLHAASPSGRAAQVNVLFVNLLNSSIFPENTSFGVHIPAKQPRAHVSTPISFQQKWHIDIGIAKPKSIWPFLKHTG